MNLVSHLCTQISKVIHPTNAINISAIESIPDQFQLFPSQTFTRNRFLITANSADTFIAALSISIFTSALDPTTYLYLDKLDTTGFQRTGGFVRQLASNTVGYFASIYNQLHVHVYCATSSEYLFPKSARDKAVLTDCDLIRWWIKTLSTTTTIPPETSIERFWFVPGESETWFKNTSGTDWKWGLAADNLVNLPRFEDDLITKTFQYSETRSISKFMDLMGAMETGSSRALISLKISNKAPQDTNAGNNKQVDWTEFMQIWYQQSYDTNDNATKSTTKVESFLKSKRIPSQSIKACPDAIKENSNENKTVESKKRIQVQDISGLIKRKKKT